MTTTQEAVRKHLEALNPHKATGPDGISPRHPKLAGPSIVPSLTEAYNQSRMVLKGEFLLGNRRPVGSVG